MFFVANRLMNPDPRFASKLLNEMLEQVRVGDTRGGCYFDVPLLLGRMINLDVRANNVILSESLLELVFPAQTRQLKPQHKQNRTKMVKQQKKNSLARFGFNCKRSGTHTSRTMMLKELQDLLSYTNHKEAQKADYLYAIDAENCLGKRSGRTRLLTYRHLVDLYALNPANTLFRALLFFWQRDILGQPLLALLCTYARDPVFRSSASFILRSPPRTKIIREELEQFIDAPEPNRFSQATLRSTARNINATWTKSGHLTGRAKKIRTQAIPTAGSISYALLLGYLTGIRGPALFATEYAKLLDCPFDKAIELAEEASRKGWITFKRIGNVIEVLFPNLLNEQEMEWLREQT
jgi:hypothetical protein